MSSLAVSLTTQRKCAGHLPIFFSPSIRTEEDLEEYKARQQTNFFPEEFFQEDKLITPNIILPVLSNSNDFQLPEDWAQEMERNVYLRDHYKQILLDNGLTEEEVNYTLQNASHKLGSAVKWSQANEELGHNAANYALASLALGVFKSVLENTEATPLFIKAVLNVTQGFTLGERGRRQYAIYARAEDEKGLDTYLSKYYGNHVSSNLIDLACTFETTVKPLVLPWLGLLETTKRDSIIALLTLPTTLFWRMKYGAYIDHRFGTSLLNYLANKSLVPISTRGNKKDAKEMMEEATEIVSLQFVKERLKTLLGVKEGESVVSKVCSLLKGLLSKDINVVEESAALLNEAMAPILGISGFFFSLIGVPVKAITSFMFGDELNDPLKRGIYSLSTWGIATQQLLYSLRFSVMEYVKSRQIRDLVSELDDDDILKKQLLENLADDRHNLFFVGLLSNVLGCCLPFVELLGDSTSLLKTSKSMVFETANSLNQYFFSKRRELKGRLFRLNNLELFQKTHPTNEKPEDLPMLKIYRGEE